MSVEIVFQRDVFDYLFVRFQHVAYVDKEPRLVPLAYFVSLEKKQFSVRR